MTNHRRESKTIVKPNKKGNVRNIDGYIGNLSVHLDTHVGYSVSDSNQPNK